MLVPRRGLLGWVAGPAVLLAFVVAVAGCTGKTVSVPNSPGKARLETGDTLQVEFGYVNPSIGQSWYLVEEPDHTVLQDLGEELDSEARPGEAGVGGEMTWRFEATAPGRTVIGFQYCFQSSLSDCEGLNEPAPEPVRLDITVR